MTPQYNVDKNNDMLDKYIFFCSFQHRWPSSILPTQKIEWYIKLLRTSLSYIFFSLFKRHKENILDLKSHKNQNSYISR